ncbi:MAG: ABC transporter ATP-binding protein [Verrucomicrobiae bacterium]|nr:ABC transporter ATP-binding protein [Verrucomicrobiae bacterium]
MKAALEIDGLRYAYPDGTVALDGVDWTVCEGQCAGLIGPNGAGKSTLLLHLNGLLPAKPAAEPRIKVMGIGVGGGNLPRVRQMVGMMFQDSDDQLFCPTVFEDVAFGPAQMGRGGEEVRLRVRETLARVGLKGFENRAPHRLSRGEKRRVCLAGVLACDPQVLVLDEPTSDLDPRGRRELKALLKTLPMTKILATHDLEMVAEICDRVVLMDGGRMVEEDVPGKLLANESLMLAHGLERPHSLSHPHAHAGGLESAT